MQLQSAEPLQGRRHERTPWHVSVSVFHEPPVHFGRPCNAYLGHNAMVSELLLVVRHGHWQFLKLVMLDTLQLLYPATLVDNLNFME